MTFSSSLQVEGLRSSPPGASPPGPRPPGALEHSILLVQSCAGCIWTELFPPAVAREGQTLTVFKNFDVAVTSKHIWCFIIFSPFHFSIVSL